MGDLLTREELRTFRKCSMGTAGRLPRQRALPVVKVGLKVLVRRSAVEFRLAAQEIPARPPPERPLPHRLARALRWPVPDDAKEGR